VRGERAHQLRRLDVDLVAQRGEAREAEPDRGHAAADLEREVAALGDQADRAAREVVGDELELGGRVEDPEAVGPEHAHARRADAGGEGKVPRAPGVAVLLAAADGHDRPRPGGDRVLHRLLERGRRHGEDRELDRAGELAQRAVGRPAEDLAAAAVDEVHVAPALAAERAHGEPVPPLQAVVGGADDGHCGGIEERREVVGGRGHRRSFQGSDVQVK
jgi:hypothetical protein